MENLDDLSRQIEELEKKKQELEKKKLELSKPITITVENVQFTGMGGVFEIKLSRYDGDIISRIQRIPSRNFISSRQVNQFKIDDYDRLVYELNEIDHKLIISDEYSLKIEEYKSSPDFILSFEEKKKQIRVDRTIKRSNIPYLYELSTWTHHSMGDYYTFAITELMEWMKYQINHPQFKFELKEEVKKIYDEQLERERLINSFADMKDAPDISFEFDWIDPNGVNHKYQLKPDQRVACKFDDVFNHRTLLSFDMGKGKTAIAIAQAERYNERVLFICKADLKTNIAREIFKFTGKKAHIFSGIEPDGLTLDLLFNPDKKLQYNILNYDVVGRSVKEEINNETHELMKWVEVINLAKFDRIIYDEAHSMKNMETQRSKGGRSLRSSKVMLLTGTPVVNRPSEIFPILNIIDPVTFYDHIVFSSQFTHSDGSPKNLDKLHRLLKTYMIRRLRDNTLDPNRIPQYTSLSQQARVNYSEVLRGLYTALRNPNYQREVHNILTELLRLKQICADDKVDFTIDLAETALDETAEMPWNKVLVFSQFKQTQYEIAKRLGNKSRVINGEVTDKRRYEIVDEFQDPRSSVKVIVTNITEGLTLTNAFTTIINDLWWTPKDHVQAEGRAFGRENDPHGGNSYYVLCEETIDDLIWTILERKLSMFKQMIDNVYNKNEEEDSMFKQLIAIFKKGL